VPAFSRLHLRAPAKATRLLPLVPALLAFGLAAAPASAAATATPRIVGGQAAPSIAAFPFQAALYIQQLGLTIGGLDIGGSEAFCGGEIIDPVQILTAAHCLTQEGTKTAVNAANVVALTGSAMLPSNQPTGPTGLAITVDPAYNPSTMDDDIAIVTFAQPLYTGAPRPDGTATVAPVPLITSADAAVFANPNATPAEPVTVSGFGETSPPPANGADTGAISSTLQDVQIHLVPDSTCANDYAGVAAITGDQICAGEPSGGKDACSGDSGGPLVVDLASPADPPADYALAGTVDFGVSCAQAGYPGVYVRIASPAITSFITGTAATVGQSLIPPIITTPPVTATATTPAGTAKAASVTVHALHTSCTASGCVVRVATVGPAALTATINRTRVHVHATGREHFTVTAPGLRSGRTYTLTLVAKRGALRGTDKVALHTAR
jgi:secreted trypsin-like serine protease